LQGKKTQWIGKISQKVLFNVLPNPNIASLIPHNQLQRWVNTKSNQPLLGLDPIMSPCHQQEEAEQTARPGGSSSLALLGTSENGPQQKSLAWEKPARENPFPEWFFEHQNSVSTTGGERPNPKGMTGGALKIETASVIKLSPIFKNLLPFILQL